MSAAFDGFRARFDFPLDDFQVQACRAIEAGQSVIVSAPTGAGKTLVAEFAIHLALASGKRIAYTTPLKALSNQKFADFARAWGDDQVGILTGDVKVNPHARVLVMTTEILRNALYGSGLDDLGYIVLDECHYMGDEGRGTVWEEIIVNAPPDVQLVGLSATVANVKEIADWISLVHRPIVAIYHPERPVPLSFAIADLAAEIHEYRAVREGRVRAVGDESRGPDDRGRWYTRRVADPAIVIEELERRHWLPAIYFIFSRVGCERALDDVLAEGRTLLTPAQRAEVDAAIGDAVADSPTIAESTLNQTVFQALRLGAGLHHAGVLPSLKRLIETLFERGLCKAVFATETMALGIHMPARSVVLQGLTKRTERGFRSLTNNELTQMAGRAGRRGIDPEGKCVIAMDARDGLEDVFRVVEGSPEPIESQFKLGYGSAALLLATGASPEVIRHRIESSFGQYQNLKKLREVENDVRRLTAELAEARQFEAPCGDLGRIGRYRRAREDAESRRRALGKGGRRGERQVAEAEVGRLALIRRRGGPELGVILGVHTMRGYKVLIDVLLPHGSVARLKSGLVKRVFWATPPLYVPRDRGRGEHDGRNDRGRRHGARGRRDGDRDGGHRDGRLQTLANELAALSIEDLIQRERAQGPDAVVQTIECHRCPWSSVPRCDQAWRESERIEARLEQRRQTLEAIRGAYWQEFLRVVEVLEQFQAVRDRELTSKGHLVASLRHDNELLVAEVVSRGVFEELSVAEAAAVCSTLIEESRSGEPNIARMFLKKHTKLRRRMDHVVAIAESVWEAQRARHLPMAVGAHPGFMPAVFRWASGDDDWTGIVEASFGGHEGDLIRVMRRLIDLLRQLADSDEVPVETSRRLAQAARAVDRGIVLESALI